MNTMVFVIAFLGLLSIYFWFPRRKQTAILALATVPVRQPSGTKVLYWPRYGNRWMIAEIVGSDGNGGAYLRRPHGYPVFRRPYASLRSR